VSNQRYPLRINVGFLANQPAGTFREIHFEFPEIVLGSDFTLKNMKGLVKISRTPQGILAEGKFAGKDKVTCVRCLTEFDQMLHAEFQELYSYELHPTAEEGMIIPEDGNIDFAPILWEYLLLEVPIKALCKPDCKGLCTVCGENLNVTTCGHQSAPES
jgi:uncharacterized protein